MKVFVAGVSGGPVQIGLGAPALTEWPDGAEVICSTADFAGNAPAVLAARLVAQKFPAIDGRPGFYRATPEAAGSRLRWAMQRVQTALDEPAVVADWPAVSKALRQHVFGTPDNELPPSVLAQIVGLHQSAITRWESGKQLPGIDSLAQIRAFAKRIGIEWNDAWLFEPAPAA